MEIPHRILRAHAKDIDPALRELTSRQQIQQERILKVAQGLFARFGRNAVTFRGLAAALKMATATLRQHFTDIDELLGEMFHRHLLHIANALGNVPQDAPNRRQAQREAYMKATRTPFGAPTEAHRMFVRNCHDLPEDVSIPLQETRLGLGELLAPGYAAEILLLLDSPLLTPNRVEAMLRACIETNWPDAPPCPNEPPPNPKPQPIRSHEKPRPAEHLLLERHPDDVMLLNCAAANAALNPAARTHAPPVR